MTMKRARYFLHTLSFLVMALGAQASDIPDGKLMPRLSFTFEGLPGVGEFEKHPLASTEKIVQALRAHMTPYPVMFVAGGKVEKHTAALKALEFWTKKEYSAFSFPWSGRPMTEIPESELIEEVRKNQNWIATYRTIGNDRGFRFPEMKVESGTKKRRELVKHLNDRQYKVVPITLGIQDGPFCEAYDRIPDKDALKRTEFRKVYLEYIQANFDHWLPIQRQFFKDNPPWILSFKLCDLNAEFMNEFLEWVHRRGHITEGVRDSIKHLFYRKDLPRYLTPDARSVFESFGRHRQRDYETSQDPQLLETYEANWKGRVERVISPPPTPVGRTIE